MSDTDFLQAIGTLVTIASVVGAAAWGVATMRSTVAHLVDSMGKLTHSVERLTGRINDLETEHTSTQNRIAAIERQTRKAAETSETR